MGNGMVIDPAHLCREMAALREKGVDISPRNLKISDRATLCMPYHVAEDGLEEDRLAESGSQFGSTRRGIAYAYGDKYMKKTLRMGDLAHLDDSVKKRLTTIATWKSLTMERVYGCLLYTSLEQVAPLAEQRQVDVQAAAAFAPQGLGQEGGIKAVLLCHGLDRRAQGHQVVRRRQGGRAAEIDLVLAGALLVVAALGPDAHIVQAQADLSAHVFALVRRGDIEVARVVKGRLGGAALFVGLDVYKRQSAASAGASTPRDLFTATPSANSFE